MNPPRAGGGDGRIRVALVAQSLDDGGLERLVQTLALTLDRDEFSPGVFPLREFGVYKAALDAAGIPVWDCRESGLRIRGIPIRLIRSLHDFRPDLIHSHSGTWLPSAVARTLLQYPRMMFTDHGRYPPEPWSRTLVEKWCAARTDVITAVSTPVAGYVTEQLGLDERPRVIPNGIDLAEFRSRRPCVREELRSEWEVGSEDVLFALVGRFVEVKNHRGLLDALARIRSRCPNVHVALFGQGPLEDEVRSRVDALALGDRVHFLGFREDMADCLHACDAFVLPSTTEGMPLSLLEALATGLPIVATRVGGVPEALGDPPAGILVASGDTGELAEAMARVAESPPERRKRLSQRAERRSEAFSIETCSRRYEDIYRELAMDRGRNDRG